MLLQCCWSIIILYEELRIPIHDKFQSSFFALKNNNDDGDNLVQVLKMPSSELTIDILGVKLQISM